MKKTVRNATLNDFEFIYDSIREDLNEQLILHRFNYSRDEFKDIIFGINPVAYFIILEINGESVGFANYSIDHRNFTANCLANLYLNDIFVKRKYRRMGGASILMDNLKEIAKTERCGRIEWLVLTNNAEALEFYEKSIKGKVINDKLQLMRLELK